MFVMLPGRSREEAFRIGAEIAAAVTAANPPPVLLKLEKARGGAEGVGPGMAGLQRKPVRHTKYATELGLESMSWPFNTQPALPAND